MAQSLAASDQTSNVNSQPSFENEFNNLALGLFTLQFEHVPTYRNICEARKATPATVANWTDIPAVPAMAFKELEMTSLPEAERTKVFHSSGTTDHRPSRHFHSAESLAIYESSLLPWFHENFCCVPPEPEPEDDDAIRPRAWNDDDQFGFVILTPSVAASPNSSLVHMFECVKEKHGTRDSFFGGRIDSSGGWTLDIEQVLFGLRRSMCANRRLGILGTAFSFVHLLDHFEKNNIRYKLASGSRVLETGGYKGRSREMPKKELHALISKHLGIPAENIICEYGMSELSSQAYDTVANDSARTQAKHRSFRFPPWARVRVLSPETGREVTDGETGLLRVVDLANVRSVMAIQTEDLAIRRGAGFELMGRAKQSEARGCSLMAS